MRITLKDVEEKIKPLGNKLSYDKEFIFDLLAVYGRAQGNITRLRNGQLNVANDKEHEVAQKGIVYFKPSSATDDELYTVIDDLKTDPAVVRYSTRFVIATNYKTLLAIDTRTGESLDIPIREIDRHYTFFLPWAGMEKAQFIAERHADVKAAEKMAKLFDALIAHNGYTTALEWHNLTTFFTRLLFCFFAEDTKIFEKGQFSNAVASYTQPDGSDLKDFLTVLFASLDDKDKEGYPSHLAAFPYVNGQLFSNFSQIPEFNKQSRDLLLESASKLDWSDINPDVFGSMFQAVVRPGERTSLGQHYTSVPNIMKTIEPLFLDELKEEFNNSYDDARKLEKLLARIGDIKIFDPACGSGNFLIIAYKELRRLEHAILERQGELTGQSQQTFLGSRINIENFYGIEIDDFPHEVAILSLWLAKHQMNLEFTEKFGIDLPLIPLKESGNIVHANAARINWNEVCPNNREDEIYLVGNPPYYGSSRQTSGQKLDLAKAFEGFDYSRNLDYISIWFIKGAQYISQSNAQLAFVSTNSVCQGDHVGMLWPYIYDYGLEIGFAHTSFKWSNSAKGSAGVTVIIVSLRNSSRVNRQVQLYSDGIHQEVDHINAYLAPAKDVIVHRSSRPVNGLPQMTRANAATDDGIFTLSDIELKNLTETDKSIVKRYFGSEEFLNDIKRYVLWLDADSYALYSSNSIVAMKINDVKEFRLGLKAGDSRRLAQVPYQFKGPKEIKRNAIIVPRVFSERREYVVAGYLSKDDIIGDSAIGIYEADPYVFGLISSRMHMAWVRAVAGRLKTDFRYSSAIVYNNFPVPPMTEAEKANIEEKSFAVLDARESHPEKTLAEMYDPDKMPDDLRAAHRELDEAVDAVYRKKPFENDEERLAHLFDLYETMTASERIKS